MAGNLSAVARRAKVAREPGMTDNAQFAALLEQLRVARPEVLTVALSTRSGLLLGSATENSDEAEALAALGASLLAAAETPAQVLVGGAAEETSARGLAGYVIALGAGPNAVLSVVAAPTASLTLLLPDLRQTAAYLGQDLPH